MKSPDNTTNNDKKELKDFGHDTDISESAEELQGNPGSNDEKEGLPHSQAQMENKDIEDGRVINEAMNRGIGMFTPDAMFDQLTQNYKQAEKLFGKTIIRAIAGYDPRYLETNSSIPEFQRELKERINSNIENYKDKNILDKHGHLTDDALKFATIQMIDDALDVKNPNPFGEKEHKKQDNVGEKQDTRILRQGDLFKDLSAKQSIKTALRRGHDKLIKEDVRIYDRKSKGNLTVIYCIDCSGSMKGEKIRMAKSAGVSLSYKAINDKNDVGLIIFADNIEASLNPAKDFHEITKMLTNIRAKKETNLVKAIDKALEMCTDTRKTYHIILLTDALHTTGDDVHTAVSTARDRKVTISMIGINLDDKGEELAKEIVDISNGKLSIVQNIDELGQVIISDYNSFR